MLAMLDADGLHCACGIVGLDVPEAKIGNQKLLLRFPLKKLNSEEVEPSQDGGPLGFKNFMTIRVNIPTTRANETSTKN